MLMHNSYLCEEYDKEGRLLPHDPKERVKVRQWVHASEATFMIHGLAIMYTQWYMPKDAPPQILEPMEQDMSVSVKKDMAWLEKELSSSSGAFLCGQNLTAADIMMQFSAELILMKQFGTKGMEYPNVKKWLEACKDTASYKRAVEKTGHKS